MGARGAPRTAGVGVAAAATLMWLAGVAAQVCPGGYECPPGGACGANASQACVACAAGKQSPSGSSPCSYCRSTLRPSPAQDGCICDSLQFDIWGSIAAGGTDSPCVACSKIPLSLLSRLADDARGQDGDLLSIFDARGDSDDRFASPCQGPSVEVRRRLKDAADGVVDGVADSADGVVESLFNDAPCDEYHHAECAGGPRGDAQLCPNGGYWLSPTVVKEGPGGGNGSALSVDGHELDWADGVLRQTGVLLQQCTPPRGGGPSRCQHWSRCVDEADTEEDAEDPWTPYVSDKEFAVWLTRRGGPADSPFINANSSCAILSSRAGTLETLDCGADGKLSDGTDCADTKLQEFRLATWNALSDGVNCCAPGFHGKLCDMCIPPLMKINDKCVKCSGNGLSVNWPKVFLGAMIAFGFTLFLMHKASVSFEEADGTATIAIFYFQIIALMFKDRATHLAWPWVMNVLEVMELGFLTNSERTCMIKLTFYQNFYFNILSTLALVFGMYGCLLALTSMTAEKKDSKVVELQKLGDARNQKAAAHIISQMTLFESLEPEYRANIVAAMSTMPALKKGEEVIKEGDKEFFLVVIDGGCEIRHEGKKVATIESGQHFGVEGLFHPHAAEATVTVMKHNTTLMLLKRKKFRAVKKQFSKAAQVSMEANLEFNNELVVVDDDSFVAPDDPAAGVEADGGSQSNGAAGGRTADGGFVSAEALAFQVAITGDTTTEYGKADATLGAKVEMEELAERTMNVTFQRMHRKQVLLEEVEIKSEFMKTAELPFVEIHKLYRASQDPTARYCGVLEGMIALYGPLTLQAMSIFFCRKVVDVDETGGQRVKEVLVVDSTQSCADGSYSTAKWFGAFVLFVFCFCVPCVMYHASKTFHDVVDGKGAREDAKTLAKARYHSHWKMMNKQDKRKKIQECEHELKLQVLGASSFLLTSFQMSVTKEAAIWYPMWYLIRRTFLNYLYFDGLRSGDSTTGIFIIARYDWRVVIAVVLVVSSILQQHFQPFRDRNEDTLEMWSLHFLTVLVVVDVADPLNSVYVCILLSIIFASLALRDVNRDRLKSNVAETQWQKIRKLQVGEGEVEVGGLMKKVSMLRKMDIEAERREADQAAKGAGSVKNPMSPGQDDDSSSDDDETPKSLKTGLSFKGKFGIGGGSDTKGVAKGKRTSSKGEPLLASPMRGDSTMRNPMLADLGIPPDDEGED